MGETAAEAPFSRSEIEVRVPSPDPDITLFGEEIAAELRRVIEERPLERQFETQIKRRLRCLNLERSLIEVAFDEGFIIVGDRQQPLTEVELELKAGEEAALYELAVRLADALPLRLDIMSKAERGFMLAADDRPLPVRAADLQFPTDATLDDAVETVIASALGQFVANWPAMEETHHRESIHQMRVALRRLRTALAFFDRVVPCDEFKIFRAEAKRIASAFSPARDWDAFREVVEDGPLTHYAQEGESFEALLTTVEGRRLAAYAIAQEVINDPSTTRFVLKLRAFLARRAWRNALSGAELLRLTEPASLFAGETLERLHKRAFKRGRRLSQKPPEERHEVRVALKNIRYAAEFFSFFSAALDPTSEQSPSSRMGSAPLTTRRAHHMSCEMSRRPPVCRLRRPQASRLVRARHGDHGRQSAKSMEVVYPSSPLLALTELFRARSGASREIPAYLARIA